MSKTLKIDYSDWYEQFEAEKPDLQSEDALVELARHGLTTTRIAQHAITARAEGVAPPDILPADKMLLLSGGRACVGVSLANRMREVEMANGNTYEVREFVAPVHDDTPEPAGGETADAVPDADTRGWVDSADPLAVDRAINYLTRAVPGHIWNRLAIIASHKGDVNAAADVLRARIDEMVERLT